MIKQQGRERFCEANLKSLRQVSDRVEQWRVFRTVKLDALEKFLAKDAGQKQKIKPTKKQNEK